MAITLRSSKSTPLTFTEMDGNFTDLNTRLNTVETTYVKTINGVSPNSSNALTLTTTNVTEGTNLFYTDARARASISVTDSGGDGSLSYNSTTGVITYVGPSASEVRAHISATSATGVTYTAGTGVIALASIPNSSITNSTITVTGDSGSTAIDLGDTLTVTGGEGIDTAQSGDTLTISAELATDSNKGVASFDSTNFTVTSGNVVLATDGINDTHIDFGTGANQVNTADLPEDPSATVSSGTMYYTDARVLTKINATSIDELSDVDTSTSSPVANDVLTWNAVDNEWQPAAAPGASGGEANTISNVGTGAEIFKTKVGVDFKLKTLIFDSNFSVTENTDDISIALTAAPDFGNIEIGSDTIANLVTNNDINIVTNGTGTVNITGDLLPGTDSTYDLGAVGTEWAQAHIDTVTATNLAGTLTTAAQTNITSVGTLNGLTIAGSQTIQMGTNRVQGVTDPVSTQDAATKNYVDNALSAGTTIFTLQADSGSNDTVETGDTIDFEGTANEIETAVTANKITIGLPSNVTITNDLTVGNQLNVAGNLTVSGTTTTVNTTDLNVADPLIRLAVGNESTDIIDIGFVGHYGDNGVAQHAGLFRDASDGKFKLFRRYSQEPSGNTINTDDVDFTLATLQAEALEIGDADSPSLHIRGSAISTVNTNQNLTLDTAGSGVIELNSITNVTGDVTLKAQSDLRFADSDSSNHIGFQAPATVASDIIWTLPNADAAVSGYALVSNAAGTLSWAAAGATTTSDTTTNAEEQLYFGDITSGVVTAVHHDADFTYNPSTGTLTADTFSGALSGNATTATTATNITVADESSDTSCNVLFVTGATGNLPPKSGTNLTFNSSTGALTATSFSGSLTGNADTATTATNVTATANNTANETVYITFVDGTTGAQGIETDTNLTYNPSTNTLTTSIFSGTATNAQYADLAERYLPDAEYPFGTVMTVGGGAEVTYCTQDSIPVGVISTAPAYLMNSELEGGVAVALVGRVPVRVVGSVVKGQVVYADHDGIASATAEGKRVGIALETNDDAGEKLVECVLKV
jgi:hypothetical protein